MTQEKTLLNELRMLNIALKRGMQTVVGGDAFHVPAVSSMALHYIFLQGGSALQKDVESEFHLRRSTASELLGRLEQEGYVTRQAEAGDSRAKRVFLSEKAEREQGEIARKFREVERHLDSALTDEERQTFFVLCEKIRKRIENPENPRGGGIIPVDMRVLVVSRIIFCHSERSRGIPTLCTAPLCKGSCRRQATEGLSGPDFSAPFASSLRSK